MIAKEKDSVEPLLRQLEVISQLPSLAKETVSKVEQELKTLKAGVKGENDSAYYIDFHYKSSKNWIAIHDLRLVYNEQVAQIDHLLVNRFLEFYVLESKNYTRGLKIDDNGEFLAVYNNHYVAIESPIEQNKRHVFLLEKLLKEEDILPKRLGIRLQPTFKPYVLVSPHSKVLRPAEKIYNTEMVIKSDVLFSKIEEAFEKQSTISALGYLSKIVAVETLQEIGQKLIAYHQPFSIDYYAKFGISLPKAQSLQPDAVPETAPVLDQSDKPQTEQGYSRYFCYTCKKAISKNVAIFCFQHKERFGGKAYCFDCQKAFSPTLS